jgi:hypothetical protein
VFAPVYFPRAYWANTPGWTYYPRTVVSLALVTNSFFVGPHGHYHYGNYYGPTWEQRGYSAWVNHAPKVYDPLYSYYQRQNPQVLTSIQTTHKEHVSGTKAPPPKVINQQNFVINQVNTTKVVDKSITNVNVKGPVQVANLSGAKESAPLPKVKVLPPDQVQKHTQTAKNLQTAAKGRKEVEAKQAQQPVVPGKPPEVKPVSVPLKEIKLPPATTAKVKPKVETPPLPGVNTAPKPKPGVKPVVPEPKQPKPGVKPPDPKQPKPGDPPDPKKPGVKPPDPKQPKPGDPPDPKKPGVKPPDPKQPKPGDPPDPKKPGVKPPDPKQPKPGDPPDPKKPKPGEKPDPKKPDPKKPKPNDPPDAKKPEPEPPPALVQAAGLIRRAGIPEMMWRHLSPTRRM